MKYISVAETAEKWNISPRRVQDYCKNGKIPGAAHFGKAWMIPEDALRPEDKRKKEAKREELKPLFRKSPFLDMTDLYNIPGGADECTKALADFPEEQMRFAAEIDYSRGEIDKVVERAQELFENKSGLYAVISSGILLSLCAMWKGDIDLWYDAKRHFFEAPIKDEKDRDVVNLAIACADSAIRDTKNFPEWFCRGCFYNLPKDALPAARVYYIKYLMIFAQELAIGNLVLDDVRGLGFMKSLPYIIEPMISQVVADKIVMAEIYLRLLCTMAYHQCGNDVFAAEHLDRAIELCLADGLYGPLVEHRRQLGLFLDERLALADQEALKKIKALHKQLHAGWTKIHNEVTGSKTSAALSIREREVARLAAFGLSDFQIANQLSLSEHTIRSLINSAKNKIGITKRSELGIYV